MMVVMSEVTATLSADRPELTTADRCDRCGAQAYVRAILPSGGELLFCRHHARAHAERLREMDGVLERAGSDGVEGPLG
jgi:ribosomal protein S14